jgi:hypothetical protein
VDEETSHHNITTQQQEKNKIKECQPPVAVVRLPLVVQQLDPQQARQHHPAPAAPQPRHRFCTGPAYQQHPNQSTKSKIIQSVKSINQTRNQSCNIIDSNVRIAQPKNQCFASANPKINTLANPEFFVF